MEIQQLTIPILVTLVGGQMEIQNQKENYVYRGELQSLSIEDNLLKVEFAWLAKGPFPPVTWEKEDDMSKLQYEVGLDYITSSNIGPGIKGGDRWFLQFTHTREVATIFPPDGSQLSPSRVKGLTYLF